MTTLATTTPTTTPTATPNALPHAMTPIDAESDDADRGSVVVVGVDGTRASARALAWAADHAESLQARLRIVTAFSHPHAGVEVPLSYVDLYQTASQAAHDNAERVIAEQFGDDRSMILEHVVAPGSIDHVISQHVSNADMVVLGTQSRGRWRNRFRSSATNRLTGHITVPVISVPEAGTA